MEALARAGIGRLTLVDHDVVAGSNLNRQLPALRSTLGRSKAEVMADRIADINPQCEVSLIQRFICGDDVDELTAAADYDYIIDAIDSLNCKVALVAAAYQRRIPVASSMGAGGKTDPNRVGRPDGFGELPTGPAHAETVTSPGCRQGGAGRVVQ